MSGAKPNPVPVEVQHVTPSGVAWACATLFCWTVTPLFIEHLTGVFDLWASNGWRYGLAALIWLPLLLLTIARGKMPPGLWKRALIPAAFSASAQVAFVASFYFTGPAMLSFGLRMQIVATAFAAAILFPAERLIIRRPSFILGGIGVIVGVIGVAALVPDAALPTDAPLDPTASADRNILGIVLAALAGAGFAGYSVAVRKCLVGVSARLSFSVISLYVGTAMLVLMVLLSSDPVPQLTSMTGGQWGSFVLSVIFGLAAGHVIYFTAITKLGVAPATGVVQLQPFTVAAASYVVFREVLSFPQIVCGTVAVGGAGLMLYTQHAVARRRKLDRLRELDKLPVDVPVALEEAELAGTEPDDRELP